MNFFVIAIILIVIFIILSGGVFGYMQYAKSKRIKENTERIQKLINKVYKELSDEGVSSIKKDSLAEYFLPKNEILYDETILTIKKHKILASGNTKTTIEGSGRLLVSDKALTIETLDLKSGKRRYLYKNIMEYLPNIFPSEYGNRLEFNYNQKNRIVIEVDEQQLKVIVKAFFLKNNPMKEETSISF
ncbi:hypothetical protein [Mycoplasma todarodis]|uniref:Uncharacterized protein n=1 Tax=Mycoplasma todarodis TaxID=1937191 RepID=A0A4R0XVX6_9MOLU|nr:hypothetical protein [Mycoplasma todarodis]TCG11956.1 hypothetical protein C4B25_00430 [Mycoplasma todarodis]